ncbi:MAG TPA: YqhA family protein [Acidimicrobiales bacterium]|nr:YqhA family protein [Acidimicrobiales bacterium]
MDSATGGSSRPETDASSRWLGLESRFERALSLSRVVVVIPVIVLLLAAISSFAYATDVFVRSVSRVVEDPNLTSHNLGFLLLLTDLFLVGATLMIAAFGFYDLFITRIDAESRSLQLPGWLRMHDLNDLKARVISMVILVAAVTFVDLVVESEGGLNTLYLGAAVALVIFALTAFLRFVR